MGVRGILLQPAPFLSLKFSCYVLKKLIAFAVTKLFMMRILFCISLAFLSLFGSTAEATVEPCPLVTERAILGVWEAVYTADTVRVFRLELNEKGPSLLSQGLPFRKTFVSVLKEKTISDGKINLLFKNQLKPVRTIVKGKEYTTKGEEAIIGTGRVCESSESKGVGNGALDVTLVMEPDSPEPRKWELRFIKVEGRELTDWLREMSDLAKDAAKQFKAEASSPSSDLMANRVADLVDSVIQKDHEQEAFTKLEALGMESVPYIVSHLSDSRRLPIQAISLINKSVNAFEGLRHYGPEVVHDALAAILNQITGQSFEFVYNGASSEQRQKNTRAWEAWCMQSFPQKATVCSGSANKLLK